MISNSRIQLLILLAGICAGPYLFAQDTEAPLADDGISVPETEAPPAKSSRKPSSSTKKSHFVEIQSDFPEEELGIAPAETGAGEAAP